MRRLLVVPLVLLAALIMAMTIRAGGASTVALQENDVSVPSPISGVGARPEDVAMFQAASAAPAGARAGWWSAVQEQIRSSEYQVTWQEQTHLLDLPAAYQAPNRAQNLRSYFAPDGLVVIPRDPSQPEAAPPWRWGLRFDAMGTAGRLRSAAEASLHPDANRIEYRRGSVTEWYVNDEAGLHQGVSFAAPPSLEVQGMPLHLLFSLHGDLAPRWASQPFAGFGPVGPVIEFVTAEGDPVIQYGGVSAVDAEGRQVPLHVSLTSAAISVRLDVSSARYPIEYRADVERLVGPFHQAYLPVVLRGYAPGGAPPPPPAPGFPDWTAEGSAAYVLSGHSVGTAGDVNNDGYDDVIIGAPWYDNGSTDEGAAFVYHGSAGGLSSTADWMAESNLPSAMLGWSVATMGDVNKDGYDDVVVGAHNYLGGAGLIQAYYGSASGLSSTPNLVLTGAQAGLPGQFGFSAGRAGDVNRDGYGDLIVGAPYCDSGERDAGCAAVYPGSATGLLASALWIAEGSNAFGHFGWSVGTAGDVNGDGYDDVVVGAPDSGHRYVNQGVAYVYYGSVSGPSATENWTVKSDQVGGVRLGKSVGTAGDVNGDGYHDVILGAEGYDSGEGNEGGAYVYYGAAAGLSATPGWIGESNQASAEYGISVGSAGDINDDGYDDILVGAHKVDNGESEEGAAFVYFGSDTGLPATPGWLLDSDQAKARYGFAVGTAGDVNGDGYADIIVGAHWYDDGDNAFAGRAFVYYGSLGARR